MPELGIEIRSCSDCRKKDVGIMLYDMLSWQRVSLMLAYDRERDIIIVDETMLMNAICMVNPTQEPKHIELGDARGMWKKRLVNLEDGR